MDKLTKYGLAGSIHEKLATILLLPASNAITGVIQQSEAAIAAKTPAPVNVPACSGERCLGSGRYTPSHPRRK